MDIMKGKIALLSGLCILCFGIYGYQGKTEANLNIVERVTDKADAKSIQNKPASVTKKQIKSKPAGTVLTTQEIKVIGKEKLFYSSKITDSVWKRIYKKSYKKDCVIPKNDLRYIQILYYGFDKKSHVGELIVNKKIEKDTIAVFKELYNKKYPIERVELIDNYNAEDEASMTANNTSCFNYRTIKGKKTLSNHSKGLAIDINPLYNPCVRTRNGVTVVEPSAGTVYANRKKQFSYKIDKNDFCYKTFKKYGFTWGGEWNSLKDYQHFEKTA
ncbi:M15 family metallopeptidase [Velocimicrobium porci]|nr:M15 family metallopeptidase [Velocimicrobium porci]